MTAKSNKAISEEMRDEIIRLHNTGMKHKQISVQVGCSPATANKYIAATGAKRKIGRPQTGWRYQDGYLVANSHRPDGRWGLLLQHVLVMEEHLGRALVKGENVHHKNGVRDDNRVENLELWNTSQPAGQRPCDKIEYAVEILRLYAPEMLKES